MIDVSGPTIRVTVLDQAGNSELLAPSDVRAEKFTYKDSERQADKVMLTVDNFDLSNFDNPIWKKGNRLRVSWGYPGRMAPERECVIRSVKGFTRLDIEARGMSVVMNRVPRSRTFENMTRLEIVRQIARENGYGDDAVDIEGGNLERVERRISSGSTRVIADIRVETNRLTRLFGSGQITADQYAQSTAQLHASYRQAQANARREVIEVRPTGDDVRFDHVVQANITDAQFLTRLANLEGVVFFVDFDGLHFHPRRLDQDPVRTYTYYTSQDQSEVIEINIKNDITALPGRTRVRRRDPIRRETTEASADNDSDTNRPTAGEMVDVVDLDTGAETQRLLTAQEEITRGGSSPSTPESAQQDARARFRRAQQRAVQATMRVVGDPNVLAKSIINLQGIGTRLSGNYYVKEVNHELDSQGYVMSLELAKDATGAYARRAARRGVGLPEVATTRSRGRRSPTDESNTGETQPTNRSRSNALQTSDLIDLDTGEERIVYSQQRGRRSNTRGGRPASPASTEAAQAGRTNR